MKKPVLLGMGSEDTRYKLIFKRNEAFKKFLYKLLEKLGFVNVYYDFLANDEKTGGEYELKLKDFKEDILHYKNKDFDVDVFFGVKKVILIIRLRNKNLCKRLLGSIKGEYIWSKIKK